MKFISGNLLEYIASGHEDPKNPGVFKKVLFTHDSLPSGYIQMINWARLPPKSSFNPHYHDGMDEVFICFQGSAQLIVDSQKFELNPGDAVHILANEIHQMINLSDQEVLYIAMGIIVSEGGKTVVVSAP